MVCLNTVALHTHRHTPFLGRFFFPSPFSYSDTNCRTRPTHSHTHTHTYAAPHTIYIFANAQGNLFKPHGVVCQVERPIRLCMEKHTYVRMGVSIVELALARTTPVHLRMYSADPVACRCGATTADIMRQSCPLFEEGFSTHNEVKKPQHIIDSGH